MAASDPCLNWLRREINSLPKDPPPGFIFDDFVCKNITKWTFGIQAHPNQREKFQLRFEFCPENPFRTPPKVTFVGPNIPLHPLVYSNGHICLGILASDWTPVMSVKSVVETIISMLASCNEMRPPADDATFVKHYNRRRLGRKSRV